jgi:tyrosinase
MTRVRREVWALSNDAADDTLKWYATGVAAMQKRPIKDSRSWRFQAAIHEYNPSGDPLRVPGEALPSASDRDRYWTQCQHGTWFFLPWHRMYLHHFESILRQDIVAAGGPADWALPYWNYSRTDNPNEARTVPPAFRNRFQADGTTPNALFVAARREGANLGQLIADELDVGTADALKESLFSDGPANGAFGGPETGFMHGGDVAGQLEVAPHGSMHVAIGGSSPAGWMSRFYTAALDPLFWLHHANIDRLWQVWLKIGQGRRNPNSDLWRETQFPFRDANAADVLMAPSEVEDTTNATLDYEYDDVGNAALAHAAMFKPTPPGAVVTSRQSRLVGATDKPFEIADGVHRAIVPAHTARAVTAASAVAAGPPKRVFVQFEHLTSSEGAPPYDVYLGVPEDADPQSHPDKRIGRLPMFGLSEASSDEGPHAGSGLTYSIEITDLLARLRSVPGWDADRVAISLVPVHPSKGARVRVGRIGLYSE